MRSFFLNIKHIYFVVNWLLSHLLNNNKWIGHNVQGLDIRSSEDYAQNKIESEKLFSSYTL